MNDSSKARKEYLVLTCGPPSAHTYQPKGKGENGEMFSEDEESDADTDDNQTVRILGVTYLFRLILISFSKHQAVKCLAMLLITLVPFPFWF